MDRKGDDCAMYGYNSDQGKWVEALTTHGWKLDDGSYSCIADMKRAGVKGANFGVGYQKAHTKACVADIQVYENNARESQYSYGSSRRTVLFTPSKTVPSVNTRNMRGQH